MIKSLFRTSAKFNFGESFFSDPFLNAINSKLVNYFLKYVKIRDSEIDSIQLYVPNDNFSYSCQHGIQKLDVELLVVNTRFPISVLWKMNTYSPFPIKPHNVDVNSELFTCWFSKLPIKSIYDELGRPKPTLDLGILKNGITVDIDHFFEDCLYVVLFFKQDYHEEENIELKVNELFDDWNKRDDVEVTGLIHNWELSKIDNKTLKIKVDLGTAGKKPLEELIKYISKITDVSSIRVTSFYS